jgi:glucose-1-phosphate cytidylyltransferase
MKVVILAGGLGTRLQEETSVKPKPMIDVGGYPLLWHIMSIYAAYGFKEFIIALGYKGAWIKKYFLDFYRLDHDFTIQLSDGQIKMHGGKREDWIVHLIDTGVNTETGGRIKKLAKWIGNETFMLTYGDGVGNINIEELLAFHREHGKTATVTAVRPPARFGAINLSNGLVSEFMEKPQTGEGLINGGFFVLEPKIFDYIKGDDTIFEREPLERLSGEGQLAGYRHEGFWQGADVLRDVKLLNSLCEGGNPPWKIGK